MKPPKWIPLKERLPAHNQKVVALSARGIGSDIGLQYLSGFYYFAVFIDGKEHEKAFKTVMRPPRNRQRFHFMCGEITASIRNFSHWFPMGDLQGKPIFF